MALGPRGSHPLTKIEGAGGMRVFALLLGCAAVLSGLPAYAQSSPAATDATAEAIPPDVDPRAVDALKAMSTYLQSLPSFRLVSESSLDVITVEDQKVQLDSVTTYQVK